MTEHSNQVHSVYDYLSLIFSGSGAAIVVAITMLLGLILVIRNHSKFDSVSFNEKGIGVKTRPQEAEELETQKKIAPETKANPIDEDKKDTITDSRDSTKKGDENNRDIHFRLFDAYVDNNMDGVRAAFEAFSHEDKNDEYWQSTYLQYLLLLGDDSSLPTLKGYATHHKKHYAATKLAEYYERAGFTNEALKFAELALEKDIPAHNRSSVFNRYFSLLLISKEKHEVMAEATKLILREDDPVKKAAVLTGIADALYNSDHKTDALSFYELALEYDPEDVEAHFQLAYKQSENSNHLLAIHHYSTVIGMRPNYNFARNNRAISFKDVGLSDVHDFEMNIENSAGKILAMTNLIYQLINNDFLEEAATILRNAEAELESRHPDQLDDEDKERVAQAESKLREKREDRDRKKDAAIDSARNFAAQRKACMTQSLTSHAGQASLALGTWNAPGYKLEISRSQQKLKAVLEISEKDYYEISLEKNWLSWQGVGTRMSKGKPENAFSLLSMPARKRFELFLIDNKIRLLATEYPISLVNKFDCMDVIFSRPKSDE